jgi:hypothetical protein
MNGQQGGKKSNKKYEARTLKELQAMAKKRGIAYSNLRKSEIIAILRSKK